MTKTCSEGVVDGASGDFASHGRRRTVAVTRPWSRAAEKPYWMCLGWW
jgi:hypothetical protein